MKVPNWLHNSGKEKKGRGRCKGRVRANRQRIRVLRAKYG